MEYQNLSVIFSDFIQRPRSIWIVRYWCYEDVYQQGADMPGTRPPVVQHAAADMLQIQLPNGEEVQSEGNVTLEANIASLQMTFEAHILNIT